MVAINTTAIPTLQRVNHFADDRMAGTVPKWANNADSIDSINNSAMSLSGAGTERNVTPPRLSFSEIIDVINPLQHLPVVSQVYRGITGDEISPVAKIAGGVIYGGALGGVTSLVSEAIEEHSGQSMGTALRQAGLNDPTYQINDEPRTAGVKRQSYNQNHTSEEKIEVVSANPPAPSVKNADIDWNDFEREERVPVTPVTIEVASAAIYKDRNQYNFNA